MDSLQSLQTKDNPQIVISKSGEVCINLEGSHTTSTETEAVNTKERKSVKFIDERETKEQNWKEESNNKLEDKKEKEDRKLTNIQNLDTSEELKEVCVIKEEYPRAINEKEVTDNEAISSKIMLNISQEQVPEKTSSLDSDQVESKSCSLKENFENLVANCSNLNEVPLEKHEMQDITDKNLETSLRFKQIVDMFDRFTKNLETLALTATPKETLNSNIKRKRSRSLLMEEPKKRKSRYEEYYEDAQRKPDCLHPPLPIKTRSVSNSSIISELIARNRFEHYLKQQEMELIEIKKYNEKEVEERENFEARTVSIGTTNYELKTLGCQTVPPDHISLNDLSLMEVSSLAGGSEQLNSPNNYAQQELACLTSYIPQPDDDKKPLIECENQQPFQPSIETQELSTAPAFNIITLEPNTTPSVRELRRTPLCRRLWSVIVDFCAAIFLCLRLNRDCIFCLGFFAAFVVSASFLTAFFYHTLNESPPLWSAGNIRL